MTLEEVLVLYQMHRIKENPNIAEELRPGHQSYEEWLKKEMGDDYVSLEDMIKMEEEARKEEDRLADEIAKDLPPIISTDFTKISGE